MFEQIEKNRDGRNVQHLCGLYGVSRSGYYDWRDRPLSQHAEDDVQLKAAIAELHQGFRRSYSSRRLDGALPQKGLSKVFVE